MKLSSSTSCRARPVPPDYSAFFTRKFWLYDVGVFFVALIVLAAAMIFLHALNSGISGSDEGPHFLNSYLVYSYWTEALGQNPLTYAKEFYIHYPKISIGHWPPLYYVFLANFFFFVPHTPFSFMIVNLVVGALPALLVARIVRQAIGLPWAVLASITYVLIPISIGNTMYLMVDQAVAGLCLLAALLWSDYAKHPSLRRGFAYAALAAAAILVKGNGWVLGVFPIIHIALTGRWRLFLNWRTYAAGALALSAVGAWTVTTYTISSDGFNYAWGLDYFLLAVPFFLSALYSNIGPIGLMAALLGIVGSYMSKDQANLREVGRLGLAMILATILLHSLIPVDLEPRYMSPAIPPIVIFMAIGVWMVVRHWQLVATRPWRVLPVALALFCIPGIVFITHRPARFDMRMDFVAAQLKEQPDGLVVVIDGSPGAEGALATEVALRDPGRQNYVVRSSQLLAKSDFMGRHYTLRANTPEVVLNSLNEISCNAVVVTEGPFIKPRFAHSDLLLSALQQPTSPFRLQQTYAHYRHDGRTYLFWRINPMALRLESVRRVNFPGKAPQETLLDSLFEPVSLGPE